MGRGSFAFLAVALLLAVLTGLAARPLGSGPSRLEVGAFEDGLLGGGWSRSERAEIDPEAAADGRVSFYYRASPANGRLRLPVEAAGPLRLALRASARVRCGVSVFAAGERVAELLVSPGRWGLYTVEIPPSAARGGPLELALALRPLPLVRGAHAEDPRILVDYLELSAPFGLRLSWLACARVAMVPLGVLLLAAWVGLGRRSALAAAAAAAAATVGLVGASPFCVTIAIPRLLPFALAAGILSHALLGRRDGLESRDRALVSCLVAAGVAFHGSLAFFPDHAPPDLDIHVRRARDLGEVPLDYAAILRYGSQLPTASQDRGTATAALGERTLIPYSPLPYVPYYGLHVLGADLHWAMTVFNAAAAMAVAPLVFLVAGGLWGRRAAWLASLLYALDLAVWHHLGRSHAPAVLGGAMGAAALLHLAERAGEMDEARRSLLAGALLGVAALAYSSLAVLFGLFGLALFGLLLADASGLRPAARRGVALAVVWGGLMAGALFYFHYLPGLVRGATGVELEPDLFPGRTFFVFHNESRQSMRLWALGLWIPLLAGLVATPVALKRAPAAARPVLLAWLLAWALLMLAKEPFLFPRLLRWAKEDQFLSPLFCLTIGAAVAALPGRRLRWGAATVVLGTALWLQLRDFGHHANSLRL